MKGLVATGVLAIVVACAADKRGGPGGGSNEPPLRIEPPQATLYVRYGIAAQQSYKVIAHDAHGDTDVTSDAALTLGDPSLGTLAGADFTSSTMNGGHTELTAMYNGQLATSDLAVLMVDTIVDPGAPPDAPGQFGMGQPGGAALQIAYPSTGVILPPNMNSFEFDFVPGSGQNLFELEFDGWSRVVDVYFTCTTLAGGCAWTPSAMTWKLLADDGRGTAPITYTLRGLDPGHLVGTAPPQTLQFTGDDLVAGIYYWAAAKGAIMRYDFGHPEIQPEAFLTVQQTTGTTCVGCHVLSRDGKVIAVGLDIPGPATLEMYDVTSKARMWTTSTGMIGFPSPNGGNFFTLSPDNSKIISSGGTNLVERSAVDGTGMTTMIQNGTMPDWAPDGSRLVYVQAGATAPASNPGVQRGSIVTVDATTFGDSHILVLSQGENNYYPSYSPDGSLVVFNRSANGSDSYNQPDARIYLVGTHGQSPVLQATASPDGGDSWPKWSTEPHMYASGQMFWLTFASRRPYGLHGAANEQIWMVGIDPQKAAQGQDASFAAFWLPFQDLTTGNHIAQWVETIQRPPCGGDSGPCPDGEYCDNGVCYPNPQ